jgi:hypothetical protein
MTSPEIDPGQSDPIGARILDLDEVEDGVVSFRVDKDTTALDVLATLAFLYPDPEVVNHYFGHLLKHMIEVKGALKNSEIRIEDPLDNDVLPNARISRKILFGDDVTFEEVNAVFEKIYGDSAAGKLRVLGERLIDRGRMIGTVRATHENEFRTATDMTIADELDLFTRQFYMDEDDGPTPSVQ